MVNSEQNELKSRILIKGVYEICFQKNGDIFVMDAQKYEQPK